MKRIFAFIFANALLSASASPLTTQEYAARFKHFNACFILYSVKEKKIIQEYNPNDRCNERIAPDSTFKIAISLMAFNEGIINQQTKFHWDGINRELPDWNQDQTPQSWLKYSVLWVSQQLTPQFGYTNIKHYLANFHYGNQDFSGDPGKHNGLTYAWLASSLKISALEQLTFLNNMLNAKLSVTKDAIVNTKKNMYLGKLDNGADYYGKTGAGRHGRNERETNPSKLRDGWFIGFIEIGSQQYIFVSNLTDKKVPSNSDKSYGSVILKPITLKLLNNYFSL